MDRAIFFGVNHCRWRHCNRHFFSAVCFGIFGNHRGRARFDFRSKKTIQREKMGTITKKGRHDGHY